MSERLRDFVETLARDFGARIELHPPSGNASKDLPEPLQELYSFCDGGDLPFGTIFRKQDVGKYSHPKPIYPDWIAFGVDDLGIYWLCANRRRDGLWFTSWDHELEKAVDGPAYSDLVGFLEEALESALERRMGLDGGSLIIERVPNSARGRVAMALKRLNGGSTAEALRSLSSLPVEESVSNLVAARQIARGLRELGVDCALKLDFL